MSPSSPIPDADAFRRARERVAGAVSRTPVLSSSTLDGRVGARVLLKAEHLQKTGAFKVRGALNHILGLDAEARDRGVTTISAGNHAQAVGWAATRVGVKARVVMPESAPRTKVRACRDYGAEVILHGDVFQAFQHALDLAGKEGLTFVHPFDDPRILAGQGTVGLEILDEVPGVDAVVVPLGGGGLCGGITAALATRGCRARVYGVEPRGAAAMQRSLEAGEAVRLDRVETVADALAPPMAGELPFAILERWVEDVVTVSDAELARAVLFLLSRTKQLVEPGGAAAVAALMSGAVPVEPGETVVAVLSGGNVDLDRIPDLIGLAGEDGSESGGGGGSPRSEGSAAPGGDEPPRAGEEA